jgi:hypothetical protein
MSRVTKTQKQHRREKRARRDRLRRNIAKSWRTKPRHFCGGWHCDWAPKGYRRSLRILWRRSRARKA